MMRKNMDKSIGDFNIFAKSTAAPGENTVQAVNDYKEFRKTDIEQSIVARFEEQVEKYGDKCAVKVGRNELTYSSLNHYANRVARVILREYDDRTRLNLAERTRYSRQLMLDKWGIEAQEKLKGAAVFCAGAGGSGSPLIMQLALTGIGTIIVCDHDEVELSNLNRQVLHDDSRIGMNKAVSAKMTIQRMNPHVKVIVHTEKITKENVHEMVGDSDIIFDNIDDMEAKFYLSECAVVKGIPHIISSMIELSSYAAVFHAPHTPCFHCLYNRGFLAEVEKIKSQVDNYKKNPNPVASPSLFLSTGFAVNEAVKILTGFENPAYNKYFFFNQEGTGSIVNSDGYRLITYPFSDHFRELSRSQGFDWDEGWSGKFVEELTISKDPHCPLCGKEGKVPIAIDVNPAAEEGAPVVASDKDVATLAAIHDNRAAAEPGDNVRTVALLFGQDIDTIVGIMGALKAGKVYVPLDAGYPVERLEYMLEDSESRVIVTDNENVDLAESLRDRVNRRIPVINIEGIDEDVPGDNLDMAAGPENPAYILYTSGSTGKPKGVMQSHRNVLHHARVYTNALHIHDNDRMTLFSSYSFDAAKMDIYGSLLNGATLYPFDIKQEGSLGRLPHWLKEEKITVFHSIPTVYRYFIDMVDGAGNFPDLRFIVLGGEAVFKQDFDKYKEYFSDECIFINGLGPTESTLTLQYFMNKETEVDREAIPVGYPVADTGVFLLTEDNREARVMEVGEIVYKSDHLALGYWNNREKTDEVFGKDPLTGEGRVYRSGDLGRCLPAGYIEYVGRKDFQVKVRGYRIELGEIEGRLDKVKGIKKSVVVCSQDRSGENYLLAYCLTENGELDEKYLIRELKAALPDYMVPNIFLKVEEFPLTATGKIDRKALAGPEDFEFVPEVEYVAPRGTTEQKLAGVWQEVLKVERVGIDDNFFVLGGNSIRAIMLTSTIHKVFDVKIPLPEVFKTPTVRALAGYIDGSGEHKFTAVPRIEKREYYTLSSAQKRLYVLQQLDMSSTGYNIPVAALLEGKIDKQRFENAFLKLIRRHESFRTYFFMAAGEPVQQVVDPEDIEFNVEYHKAEPAEIPSHGIMGAVPVNDLIRDFTRPFDLSTAPLIRVRLLELEEKKHILSVDIHHIVADGTSLPILVREFMAFYAGKDITPSAIQYKDFAYWQNKEFETGILKKQEKFWLEEFAGDMPVLNLPVDFSRPAVQSFAGDSRVFEIESGQANVLNELALKNETTLFMVLLTIYNIFLFKLSSREDIVVGTPIAGRNHAELGSVIGMFVNTLALRNYPTGEKTFLTFLEEVKENALQVFENREYPFEELVETVSVNRDAGRNPVFDVVFALQNFQARTDTIPEVDIEELKFKPFKKERKTAKFDMNMMAVEKGDSISFIFEYSTRLFREETIDRFIRYFKELVSHVIEMPGLEISDIDIIPQVEKEKLLHEFNDTQRDYPDDLTIYDVFLKEVEKMPDQAALFIEGKPELETDRETAHLPSGYITYGELNRQAGIIAAELIDKGVMPDTIVGLMVERSIEMIVGIMAILKAGGAYMPIEISFPVERTRYMIADSNAKILLAACSLGKEVETLNAGIETLFIEEAGKRQEAIAIKKKQTNRPVGDAYMRPGTGRDLIHQIPRTVETQHLASKHAVPGRGEGLAYVIYTSGTTGKPKGVLTRHYNVTRVVKNTNYIDIQPDDRVLQLSNYAFDGSVFDIYGALLNGAALIMVRQDDLLALHKLTAAIKRQGVTVFFVTTALFNALVDLEIGCFDQVRKVLFGGERVSVNHSRKALEYLGKDRVIHVYGPTETTVYAAYYDINEIGEEASTIPIGKPIANTSVYILDKNLRLVPMGVNGEIYIGGTGVARGYLNSPELTANKFVNNESNKSFLGVQGAIFQKSPLAAGGTIYSTGDLARRLPDGNIEFIGRIDQQVKIRGFRIELEEIETRLLEHEGVEEAVVLAESGHDGGKYLCTYFVGNGDAVPGPGILREFLSRTLPDHMIPEYFISLERIPLTANGKLDRKALPEPEVKAVDVYAAPEGELEGRLLDIWSEVLGVDKQKMGVNGNFFEFGGHSIKAVTLIAKVHREFNVKVPLVEIFKNPTVRGMAAYIEETEKVEYIPIEISEKKEYYQLSSNQKRLWVLHELDPESPAYNISARFELKHRVDTEIIKKCLRQLVVRHESLRTKFITVAKQLSQSVFEEADLPFTEIDISSCRGEDAREQRARIFFETRTKPFDLARGPLFRAVLVKLGNERYELIYTIHHIVSDGWSMEIMKNEFSFFYEHYRTGKESEPGPMRLQYKDFAEWNHKQLQEPGVIEKAHRFWLEKLEDGVPALELPVDFSENKHDVTGAAYTTRLCSEHREALRELAEKHNTSLFMVLFSAYIYWLAQYSEDEDITCSIIGAGRDRISLHGIIGFFVNSIIFKTRVDYEESFSDFLERVNMDILEAFQYQDYPPEKVFADLKMQYPDIPVSFNMINIQETTTKMELDSFDAYHTPNAQDVKFDIEPYITEYSNGINLIWNYKKKLFKPESIEYLIGEYLDIIDFFVRNPGKNIDSYLDDDAERTFAKN